MHVELARESIVIKCSLQASIMTGNYEFYYASGLLCKILGREVPADIKPDALGELVQKLLASYEPTDGREVHLKQMLRYYHPNVDRYDDQMAQLLKMGLEEPHMWVR